MTIPSITTIFNHMNIKYPSIFTFRQDTASPDNDQIIDDYIQICKVEGKSLVWLIHKWLLKGKPLSSTRIYRILETHGIDPSTGTRYSDQQIEVIKEKLRESKRKSRKTK